MSKPNEAKAVDKGREAFLKEAGELYDEMIRRAGGTDVFDDIEEQGEAAGRAMALRMLKDRLAAEAQAQPAEAACEKCGRPARLTKDPRGRNLQTASGTVHYARPHAICDPCKASFSPSGPAAEDSAPGGVGAVPAQGVRGKRGRVIPEGRAADEAAGRRDDQRQGGPTGHRARGGRSGRGTPPTHR